MSDLEADILAALRAVLDAPDLGLDDDFFDAGGTSMLAAELLGRLEKLLGRRLPLGLVSEATTGRRLADRLADGMAYPTRCLSTLNSSTASVSLFCVHGMGGHVLTFARLARDLADVSRFYAFESIGRSDPRQADTSVPAMAQRYLAELRQVQPQGPYWLAGYSMGGVVAIELARRLADDGEKIPLVALIDSDLAQIEREPMKNRAIEFVSRSLGIDPPVCLPYEQLDQGVARMTAALAARPGGSAIPADNLRNFVNAYVDNERALESYAVPRYDGPTHVYYSQDGPHSQLTPDTALDGLGWSPFLAREKATVIAVPGDHWTILSDHVGVIEANLRQAIGRA